MDDNKTLRTSHESMQYVIIVKRDGVNKYLCRDYMKKYAFQYTVCLNKAKRFQSETQAEKAIEWLSNEDITRVVPVLVELKVGVDV